MSPQSSQGHNDKRIYDGRLERRRSEMYLLFFIFFFFGGGVGYKGGRQTWKKGVHDMKLPKNQFFKLILEKLK